MIEQIEIYSVEELTKHLNGLGNHYIYRGQANAAWTLTSTLERLLGGSWSRDGAHRFEQYSLGQFKSKLHLYNRDNHSPRTTLAWLSAMQHYGVPTRLLDFTESPYVALYFALESYSNHSTDDFAVYALDYRKLMDRSTKYLESQDATFSETSVSLYEKRDELFEKIVSRFNYQIAWVTEPIEMNARLDRQAGSFLLSANHNLRIEQVLELPIYEGVSVCKYRIANALYTGLFSLLKKMNITSKSLYGDLDGLGRSIRMEMQAYAAPSESSSSCL
ncbi:MAG: FRG domain-containing protein [Acidobacteriaceae bacterium]|nr:FRG domain-containing protein [Acidobacteriaceae bacterium]